MQIKTHLALGRVSNLPTVLSNVLVAGALAGVLFPSDGWTALLVAMCGFYISGMYYNDACDAEYDRIHQPFRPIPSGLISRRRVELYALYIALLSLLLVYLARMQAPMAQASGNAGWLLGSLALIGCIVFYDHHHKNNPFSPAIMAACRLLVLLTSSYTLSGALPLDVCYAMLALFFWLTGLTYLAKNESKNKTINHNILAYWPMVVLCLPLAIGLIFGFTEPAVFLPLGLLIWVILKNRTIAALIAGICLVDGLFLSAVWGLPGAMVSIATFVLTLKLQRWVAGT